MNRQDYNKQILDYIAAYINLYPNQRFGQILVNLNIIQINPRGEIIDPFYEESQATFEMVKLSMPK